MDDFGGMHRLTVTVQPPVVLFGELLYGRRSQPEAAPGCRGASVAHWDNQILGATTGAARHLACALRVMPGRMFSTLIAKLTSGAQPWWRSAAPCAGAPGPHDQYHVDQLHLPHLVVVTEGPAGKDDPGFYFIETPHARLRALRINILYQPYRGQGRGDDAVQVVAYASFLQPSRCLPVRRSSQAQRRLGATNIA